MTSSRQILRYQNIKLELMLGWMCCLTLTGSSFRTQVSMVLFATEVRKNKMKKNTTLFEQFQNPIEKS
jgi:hypothetical protein